jgi:hypothetical protein
MSVRKGIVVGIVIALLAGFLGAPLAAGAEAMEMDKPTGIDITFDLMLARPLGFAGLVLGTGIFLVASPLAIATGSTKSVAHALVTEPYEFTFVRNLGEY